jgi:hypothetical protein
VQLTSLVIDRVFLQLVVLRVLRRKMAVKSYRLLMLKEQHHEGHEEHEEIQARRNPIMKKSPHKAASFSLSNPWL